MVYTEIQERNKKKYYYRVKSVREGNKVSKKRIYLGVGLSKKTLNEKEKIADLKLNKSKDSKSFSNLKLKVLKILKKYKIKKAGIFGSYALGKQKKNSDVDILIKPTKNMGMFDIVRIENELSEKIGKEVDLITYNGVNHLLRKRILKEEVRII